VADIGRDTTLFGNDLFHRVRSGLFHKVRSEVHDVTCMIQILIT